MPQARHGGRQGGGSASSLLLLLVVGWCSLFLAVSAATPPTTAATATTTAVTTAPLPLTATEMAAAPPLAAASSADAAAAPVDDDDGSDDDSSAPLVTPATGAGSTTTTTTTGPLAAASAVTAPAASAARSAAAVAASAAANGTGRASSVVSGLADATSSAASSAGSTVGAAAAGAAAGAASATGAAAAGAASATGAAAAGAATLPFISYSDPGPAVPFNLGQFLDIQRQNLITRVVDGLLRMSGDAAAQPVRALPGPLVDQPELRAPGQRWALPQLPQLGSAEQRAAADAAGERYRAAADRAQAAAARTAARLGLPAEGAPPALPGSTGAVNPFMNVTTARRYNSSKAWRGNFRRGATNGSGPGNSTTARFSPASGTYYEEGLGAPLADAAAAASDVIDDAAPAGIATVPAGPGLPTLGFGGSGPLFIFYAGVAEGLMQKGLLVPGVSQLSGFSGGALAAVLIAAGVPPRKALEMYRVSPLFCNGTLPDKWWQRPPFEAKAALRAYADECMKTARWPLDVVADTIEKYVPAESLANVSATAQVWASEVSPLFYYAQRSWPMAPFRSVPDLAAKVAASSAVPCAITPETYRLVDGRAYIDGGFTASTNQLCINATAASPCVTVTATHFGPHGWVPLMRPEATGGSTCDESVMIPPVWGLQARPPVGYGPQWNLDPVRDRLTVRRHQCAVPEVLDLLVLSERHAVPPPGFPGWAINPGKRTPMPISVCEFKGLLFGKANMTTATAIYEHGVAEARAFAAEVYGR